MARFVLAALSLVGVVVVPVYAQSSYAQKQTPTSSTSTPDLNRLRESLRKSLKGSSGSSAESGESGSSLKDRLSKAKEGKDGKEGQQGKEGEEGKKGPEEGKDKAAAPPQPRAKEAKVAGKQGGAKGAQSGVRATSPGGGAGGGGATAVRTTGQGTFDPLKDREVEYGDVPDAGEPMTLNGPVSVKEFVDTLVLATNWNAVVTPDAEKVNLIFWITEMKPKEALEVLKFHDVYYEYKEDTKYLYVMTKQEYQQKKFGKQQEEEFVVKHASVDYIESVLTSLLSEKGRVLTDPRTQHIIVWDTEDNIAKMKSTVKELDVPLDEAIFTIHNADLADVETVLTMLLSQGGTLVADPRTGSLLVKDLKSNIAQMEAAVAKLDVPLESRVYTILNVSADTLSESVESLLTERGKMQVDPHSNVLVVTDVVSRQDQIAELVKALDKKLETRTWTLNYVAPEDVSERIESLVPEEMGTVVTDEDVHQITVTAVSERIKEIDDLIKAWDVTRKQVQIEAYLLSVSNDIQRELSIDWSYFGSRGSSPFEVRGNEGSSPDYTADSSNTLTVGQLPYMTALRNPFTGDIIENINGDSVVDAFHGNNLAATINYLEKHGDVTLLSTPRVTVQDGEEALFESGSQIPYVTSSSYGSSSYYNPYSSSSTYNASSTTTGSNYNYNYGYGGYNNYPYNRIEFMEVGTILNVMPRITEDDSILMDIAAEDSTADVSNKVVSNGQENTVPLKKQSRAETQVRVEDGHTIVIGGLRTGSNSVTTTKTFPLLSDIPVLGRIFKNPSKTVKHESLMIFITPTVVDGSTQPEAQQLAQADEKVAKSLRKEEKTAFGRFAENLQRGKGDIYVSVGQSGQIMCDGTQVTLDELKTKLKSVKLRPASALVLRTHPRAPEDVVAAVTDTALENHVRVVVNNEFPAYVAPALGAPNKAREKAEKKSEESKAEESKPAELEKRAEEPKPAETGTPAEAAKPEEGAAPAVVEAEKPADGEAK